MKSRAVEQRVRRSRSALPKATRRHKAGGLQGSREAGSQSLDGSRRPVSRDHAPLPEPKLPEIETGTEVFAVDPLTIKAHFEVDYVHSYKQDTPFFHGLAKRKLLGSVCTHCNYRYATPRSHCMYCGGKTEWFELPAEGRVHSWTTCYFAAQEFLKDVPFTLVLVEFEGVDTLFLSRLIGVERGNIQIGMPIKPKFRRKATWSVRDVYFVRAGGPTRKAEIRRL